MASVRTHTRQTRNGSTTVHQHARSNRGKNWSQMQKTRRRRKRRGLQPRRGWDRLVKARRYSKRRKSVLAFGFGAVGTFELGAWAVSRGAMAIGACAFVLAAACVIPIVWAVRKDMKAGAQ